MESWRLSKIQEELDQLVMSAMADVPHESFSSSQNSVSTPVTPSTPRSKDTQAGQGTPLRRLKHAGRHNIYSDIVIKPDGSGGITDEQAKMGILRITGKYESPNNMRHSTGGREFGERPPPPVRQSSFSRDADVRPFSGRSSGYYEPTEAILDEVLQAEDTLPKDRVPIYSNGRFYSAVSAQDLSKARSLPRDMTLGKVLRGGSGRKIAGIHGRRSMHMSPSELDLLNDYESREDLVKRDPRTSTPDTSHYRQVTENQQAPPKTEEPKQPDKSPARPKKSITEAEQLQIELFYRSHKSEVFVCQCPADLYVASTRHSSLMGSDTSPWKKVKTGVPVLVLDSGEGHRERRLYIILAEKGTGFALWRDSVNHLTNYKAPTVTFHTLHHSKDHSKVSGFNFQDPKSAMEFLNRYRELTANPHDEAFNISALNIKTKKKESSRFRRFKGKSKTLSKADISQPCCFTHITKLDGPNGELVIQSSPVPALTPCAPGFIKSRTLNR